MVGETGLVNQLQKRGFTVEQMQTDAKLHEITTTGKPDLQSFVPDRFRIWMPVQATEARTTSRQVREVTYYAVDKAQGLCAVSCIDVPVGTNNLAVPGPLLLDNALALIIKKPERNRRTVAIELV